MFWWFLRLQTLRLICLTLPWLFRFRAFSGAEAQRLGRILRPKECDSHFYSIVTRQTIEEGFAEKRQKFLAEQGYDYSILTEAELDK